MKCEICNQGPPDGPSIWRVNPRGVPGIWRCNEHLTDEQRANITSDLMGIVKILERPAIESIVREKIRAKWVNPDYVDAPYKVAFAQWGESDQPVIRPARIFLFIGGPYNGQMRYVDFENRPPSNIFMGCLYQLSGAWGMQGWHRAYVIMSEERKPATRAAILKHFGDHEE